MCKIAGNAFIVGACMKKLATKTFFELCGITLKDKVVFAVALMMWSVAAPLSASAQTLGDMMCSVSHNIATFQPLFVGLAYITGSILIGMGLLQLAIFTDTINSGRQFGVSRPKGYLVSGSGLLALPSFLGWAEHTLFGLNDLGSGIVGCIPGAAGAVRGEHGIGGVAGLDNLMINLIENIKNPMTNALSVIAILIGLFMVMRGLIKGAKFGQDAKSSIPTILANVIIGTILYTVGTSLNEIEATVFGDSNISGPNIVTSAIAYDFGADTQPFQSAVYAALTFFQLIGFIAFIRGWMILRDSVDGGGGGGQNKIAQGLTHIFGGVLAVNIYRFLEAMDATFGTGFL